jgi:hypothetical protein
MKTLRQGDVLLIRVRDRKQMGTPLKRDSGRIVLAYGEATGHAHVVVAECDECFTADDQTFLRLIEDGSLQHQNGVNGPLTGEHESVAVPKGLYRVVRQSEYQYGEARRVED